MKAFLLAAVVAISQGSLSCSLLFNGLDGAARSRLRGSVPDETIALRKSNQSAQGDEVHSNKLDQPMKSTPHGICVYALPPHFHVGLTNSTFRLPVPKPVNMSPAHSPPLQGMHDTNQFSLERIFFDRIHAVATETRPARKCVMFYIPYFVSWETSSQNIWKQPIRPEWDTELFTHLTHYNSSGMPGSNHFIVVGRISYNVKSFLKLPVFQHLVKLVLEDTDPGAFKNVFAVPYPTWFRYYPGLEKPLGAEKQTLQVHAASFRSMQHSTGCKPEWELTSRMRAACNGKSFCSFHITPKLASTDKRPLCPVVGVFGKYSCGNGAPMEFETKPDEVATGHAVVLGCNRGPCWLWGTCLSAPSDKPSGQTTRSGPLVVVIGSARHSEYERAAIFKMCKDRPQMCAIFDTGKRENSSSYVEHHEVDMYQLLMAGTFCVNPPGDTPTRKGLFDSLVLGCIPVVTSEDSFQHYRFHLPAWRSMSVLVTTEQIFSKNFNLVDFLDDYARRHPDELKAKQAALRNSAYSLQYSQHPSTRVLRGPDAFDRILENMLARPSSFGLQLDFPGVYTIENAASGRKLFARTVGDYEHEFGAVIGYTGSADQQWEFQGKGDGSCCYRIVNAASKRVLFAQVATSDSDKFGASIAAKPWWAEQKWRLTPQGDGTFTISNVASGRRLFATPGEHGFDGCGATLNSPGDASQRWRVVLQTRVR